MMAKMVEGTSPRVEEFKGDVAIWAGKGGDDATGLVITPTAAVQSAVRLLATVAKIRGDNLPVMPVAKITGERVVLDDGEPAMKMVITVDGAPLGLFVDLTEFAEMVARMSIASREMDRPGG